MKIMVPVAEETTEAVAFLQKLSAQGRLKPLMDKRFDLSEIAQAHAYVEAGHKQGNVVVQV